MINYPTSLDTLTNPTSTDPQNNPSHSGQHADANDAIEALQVKVGANSSAVAASHDYILNHPHEKLFGAIHAPSGFLLNGQIVPSVASNNLTVALKTLAGNDPSATNPIYVRIGNTIRTITSALSVTKNAGTNWCASGSAELATKEIDYFVYLGYNATDGVVLGYSRIPYGALYGDFSATTTNEKHCAISTITNAAAGDNYVNIGRFAATLSAGAGYTWTVPTFTEKNLINRPIYETRGSDWTPTVSATESMTVALAGTDEWKRYQIIGRRMFIQYTCIHTRGGTASFQIQYTLPMSASLEGSTGLNANMSLGSGIGDHSNGALSGVVIQYGQLNRADVRNAGTNYSLGTSHFRFSVSYLI